MTRRFCALPAAPRLLSCLVLASAILALQCAGRRLAGPDDWISVAAGERPPSARVVVLVPGATGSMLRDESGAIRWGRGSNLLRPRDGGYALIRPLAPGGAPATLEASAVIDTIRVLGVVRKPIYGPLLRGLEAIGYQRGELTNPRPTDTLLPFAWDWRGSHAEGAAKLATSLEAVRRARGAEVLSVALVCQSSGAHLCRFFAKYGGASLEEVEAGRGRTPERIDVSAIVLVGSSNGGSLRILRELDRGRRYVPLIGRVSQPETLFTFPALYEDLPAYRRDLFVSGEGEALDIDLYDAQSWVRFGWSAFGEEARRRLARLADSTPLGNEPQRLDYLRSTLDRAQRFQQVLRADVGGSRSPRYHLIQGRSDTRTPDRAVLVRAGGTKRGRAGGADSEAADAEAAGWRLLFAGDAEVDRDPRLLGITAAAGDGHATLQSQQWLSPEEIASARPTVYVPGAHFEMILTPEAASAIVRALSE